VRRHRVPADRGHRMCGIVGAVAQRAVGAVLLEGLKRLEYRGYDSAGMAVVGEGALERVRAVGEARGRRADGRPAPRSCGPVMAHRHACEGVALVHNGIVENCQSLREKLLAAGTRFESETDSEVVLHAVRGRLAGGSDLLRAVQETVAELDGAFAIGVISAT